MSDSVDLPEKAIQLVEGERTKEAVAQGVASVYRWEKKRMGESLGAKRRKTFESKVNLQEFRKLCEKGTLTRH